MGSNYRKEHSILEYAVKKGDLIRPTCCQVCGYAGKTITGKRNPWTDEPLPDEFVNWIVGHHPDYTKPLEVVWVCQSCHTKIHRNMECKNV